MLSLKCDQCEGEEKNSDLKELHDSLVRLMNINNKKQKIEFLTSVVEERQVIRQRRVFNY
jgi:hypothetical protein